MDTSKIAERYARALLNLARDNDREDEVRNDIAALESLLLESDDLRAFLCHPRLSREQRSSGLQAIFESRLTPLTYTFMRFMNDRNRLDCLQEACRAFGRLYDLQHGILGVSLVSAETMSDDQVETISQKLGQQFGRKIKLSAFTDPDLIAGFLLRVGDKVYDYSIGGKLNAIRRKLAGSTV